MRIRTIKPEFFLHEGLFELERETSVPIRLAFAGLWGVADREGRFKWEPRKIGVQILPYDGIEFSRVLDALTTRGFIQKYQVDGVDYGVIPSFTTHQVINNRESASSLPIPTPDCICDACPTRDSRDDHASKAEGKGREGKGMDLLSDSGRVGYSEFIESLWLLFPSGSKGRSSKKQLAEAWARTRPRPDESSVESSLRKWAKSHEWTKDGGQFAAGAHLWVKNRKWEVEPAPAPKKEERRPGSGF